MFAPAVKGRSLLLLLLLLLIPAAVLAHGGGTPQLINEPAGPYWVSIWTTPDPARVGAFHLTLGISEAGDGREAGPPVLGAEVRVRLEPAAAVEGRPVSTVATNEQATNKLFYEADLMIPAEGAWNVRVDVEGQDGAGSVAFPLTVEPAQSTNWSLLGIGGVGLVAALFAFFSWRRST